MATFFRTSTHTRLSFIVDGLSRLWLHHAWPSNVARHATHLRTFSQSRSILLKNLPASLTSTTALDKDPPSSKRTNANNNNNNKKPPPKLFQTPVPKQSSPTERKFRAQRKNRVSSVWTDEEDKEILRLAKEGKDSYDVYAGHFRHRSYRSVACRMTYALTADKILRQHAEGSVQSGEDGEDRAVVDAVLAAGESAPLRTLYRAIKLAKAKQRAADKSDGAVQRSRYTKKPKSRSREWTPEEDELLERLVEKHVDLPDPTIWYRVSGGTIDGKILLRAGPACMRRWRALYPPPLARAGRWSAEEELRLQKAISEQFEGKYQVLIDVLPDSPSAQAKGEVQEYLEKQHLQQLPSQSSLPILKQGSRRLRMLNWVMIADRVQSRSDCDCRGHFYTVYHNGNRGAWSREELERMKEGVEMFGKDYWKIAEHVGTRSSIQVNKLACFQRAKEKEMRAADQRQKARETKQLQKE